MIGSVLVTLNAAEFDEPNAIKQIKSHGAFEMGAQIGSRIPIVIEADSSKQLEQLTNWLLDVPGIVHVDVVFVQDEGPDRPLN